MSVRDELRRNMPLFPIGIVTKLTELSPRQIRYYEQQGLIRPERTKGNQRLFSFNDVDRLLQIKSYLEKGLNLAGVREMFKQNQQVLEAKREVERVKKELTERELRRMLKQQIIHPNRPGQIPLTHGEMSRFFRH
ncbi:MULTISPECIES: MerR family transcriptional regulator [Thermoactinomyces]|jgi:MerR family transcriptional regulator, glutamine synthetase repressor|uniref:MerR family transcriptional regulator n=1 Tax=Thermoactinomyces daqus TaxID=1329516 RepID=A0A7W1X904_9BACL|nr:MULTISPECIES: MerR family transcriptional regulator [Thermoactinomyces]MBA4542210.1 MerR family transcriptional regulator [Thermoactinomyces daqus]MBH8598339.1 MerR family transcriptional regulator [Thermoactinomyces sp. CICC 10523]MBH8604463.1 MerR family transcriptional regulator [Thermoactinomyces sp. CICC 10522]MBH8607537.1 MerR family transcriptional regulator [Thermoactinomyces sp. CICC 10521]